VTDNPLRSTEGQAFLARLWDYRATLSATDQRLLDTLVAASGATQNDVEGYVLFGGSVPFGPTNPFGGGAPFGAGSTFGAGSSFGQNATTQGQQSS
jgi:hypothetical protein